MSIPDSVKNFGRNLFFLVVGLLGVWVLVSVLQKFIPLPLWLGALLGVLYVLPPLWFLTQYVTSYRKHATIAVLGIAIIAAVLNSYDLYVAQDPLLSQDAQQGQRGRWNFLGNLIGSAKANQVAADRSYINRADVEIAKKKSLERNASLEQYKKDWDLVAYTEREKALTEKYKVAESLRGEKSQVTSVSQSPVNGDTITFGGSSPIEIGELQPGQTLRLNYQSGTIVSNANTGWSSPICGWPLSQTLSVWKEGLPYRAEGMNTDAVYVQLSGGAHKAFSCGSNVLEITNTSKKAMSATLNIHDAFPADDSGDATFRREIR